MMKVLRRSCKKPFVANSVTYIQSIVILYYKATIKDILGFQKWVTLSCIFTWSTICSSSLTRPSSFLSRTIGLHALASSVGRMLKLQLLHLCHS